MKRLVLVPLLAAAALTGCVTDYAYRGGDQGDYYYGRPSVEYRYRDPYGYGPYGYGGYGGFFGYFGGGYPYYGSPYYGYPYYGYPYYRPPVIVRRPPDDGPAPHRRGDHRPPPWRDLRPRPPMVPSPSNETRPVAPQVRSVPRHSDGGGSRMEQVIRRSRPRPAGLER